MLGFRVHKLFCRSIVFFRSIFYLFLFYFYVFFVGVFFNIAGANECTEALLGRMFCMSGQVQEQFVCSVNVLSSKSSLFCS